MAVSVDIGLVGDRELRATFARLPPAVQKKVARKGLRVGGKIILVAAKANALARSKSGPKSFMRWLSRKLKLRAVTRRRGVIGVQVITPSQAEIFGFTPIEFRVGGRGKKKRFGAFVAKYRYPPAHIELGTSKTPALPYLRPAADANKERAFAAVGASMGEALSEEWAKS